jgi:hypothetical protein
MTGAQGENHTPTQQLPRSDASERLREPEFPLAVRGYDRRAVDEYIAELVEVVEDLEGRQLREKVVQRALDEVGEETAGILQRAHETADELAARSRAQAEGRLQRAEREAEIVKAEADKYAEQVAVDTRLLWEQRQELIEEVRRLADEVLATADDAVERLAMPEAVAAGLAGVPPLDEAGEPQDEAPAPEDAPTANLDGAPVGNDG